MRNMIITRRSFGKFWLGGSTMERETGFEPATSSLGSWHSTPELLPLQSYRTNKNSGRYSLPYASFDTVSSQKCEGSLSRLRNLVD